MDKMLEKALKAAVREEVAAKLSGAEAGPQQVKAQVSEAVDTLAFEFGVQFGPRQADSLIRSIIDDFLYYGPLQPLLDDNSITEIMVNGGGVNSADPGLPYLAPVVYIEREGKLDYCPDVVFDDAEHLRRIINKIAEQAGTQCDESHPMGCAMLPGGRARATYVVPPLAPDGPALNLRMFKSDLLHMDNLERAGALTSAMSDFLQAAVSARCPLLISGGTGSGKTTLLNALSGFIPSYERVITIEDAPELHLLAPHTERMQTREANIEGQGLISMRDLVAIALRRRPDRIIVGECRGAEAYDMLQAMQTDHPGSMTTIHANDPSNAISRLATMVGYANGDLRHEIIIQQIAESLRGGLVVHTERLSDGRRKITSMVAIDSLPEGGKVIPQAELFAYDRQGVDERGWNVGTWRACGIQPQFIKRRILEAGVWYDPQWFFDA